MRRINSAPHQTDAELNFIKIPANEKVQPNSCTFCGSLNRCPCVVEGDDDAVLCGDLIYLSDELGRVDVQKLDRVRDLRVSVSLWQRIFGVGSVTVVSTDKSIPELTLKNIRQPNEVKELIHEHVEKMKIERRMRIGEMSMDTDDDSIDLEDIN